MVYRASVAANAEPMFSLPFMKKTEDELIEICHVVIMMCEALQAAVGDLFTWKIANVLGLCELPLEMSLLQGTMYYALVNNNANLLEKTQS